MKSTIYLVVMLASALTVGFAIRGILGNAAVDVPESLVLADDAAVPLPTEHSAEHLKRSPDGTIHYLFQEPPTHALAKRELALIEECAAEEAGHKTAAEREGVKEDQPQQYDVKYAVVWDPVKKALVFDNWEKLPMPTFESHRWYPSTFGVLR